LAARGEETAEPLLVLHGFPTSSFDFHAVVEAWAEHRRVLLLDLVGFGLSDKPDRRYSVETYADGVQAFVDGLGVRRLAMVSHDLGDTVGGELLARTLEGSWPVEVTRRVLTNGSIYIAMAQLTVGQQVLLSLPDERLDPGTGIDGEAMAASLAGTFGPTSSVDGAELAAAWELIAHHRGQLLLPRTIRYIEDRRRHEDRYTGAIETHPSPLAVVWGTEDPVAVRAMADRLVEARPGTPLTWLEGVGHYPMLEAPGAFAAAVAAGLA
ncbi:MAG TPA: alpha/beta hydrolase, partial [Acidimicrobiales bacterium]|nr:alpha/beta hydrolase [Acidimicrobiales bacterium]